MDAVAARLWKDTVSYVKHSLFADDAVATPLTVGHAGRFAVLYRQTYGQSPHTTLRG